MPASQRGLVIARRETRCPRECSLRHSWMAVIGCSFGLLWVASGRSFHSPSNIRSSARRSAPTGQRRRSESATTPCSTFASTIAPTRIFLRVADLRARCDSNLRRRALTNCSLALSCSSLPSSDLTSRDHGLALTGQREMLPCPGVLVWPKSPKNMILVTYDIRPTSQLGVHLSEFIHSCKGLQSRCHANSPPSNSRRSATGPATT